MDLEVKKTLGRINELEGALAAIVPFIPVSTVADGGPNAHSEHVRAADQVRAALGKSFENVGVDIAAAEARTLEAVEVMTNLEIRELMHNYSRIVQTGHYSDTEFDCLQDVIGFVRAAIKQSILAEVSK